MSRSSRGPRASPSSGPESGSATPRDRRASHRAAIEIPAVLHGGTGEVACSVRDLSTQGMALVLKQSLAPGMVVRVSFRLPNAPQPLEVAGVLVRAAAGEGAHTVGVEFVQPPADVLRAIETFVRRNRSDGPLSRRRPEGPDTGPVITSESAASLRGLYKKAVAEVGKKDGKRRGLLDRWLRRDRS